MKKIVYISPENNKLHVVHPADKESIERHMGEMTDEEYEYHVISRSIPKNVTQYRFIDDNDLPEDREFREAWCDVTSESRIDIDCSKAKEIALNRLRQIRNKKLDDTDKEILRAQELGLDTTNIKELRQSLRNVTEPLKALDVVDKYNDAALLQEIKDKSKL